MENDKNGFGKQNPVLAKLWPDKNVFLARFFGKTKSSGKIRQGELRRSGTRTFSYSVAKIIILCMCFEKLFNFEHP